MTTFLLSILLLIFIHSHAIYAFYPDPNEKLVASALNEFDLDALPRDYRASYSVDECLGAFSNVYRKLTPLSSGWYGTVFRLEDNTNTGGYILKAIPLRQKDVFVRTLGELGGIVPFDEVRVSRALTVGVRDWSSDMFLETIDWFQCNHEEMMQRFCADAPASSGGKCLSWPEKRRKRALKIDTQYIITKEIPGPTVAQVLPQIAQPNLAMANRWMDRAINFIRSVAFQTIFALSVAHTQLDFGHFDLNLKNLKLAQPDFPMGCTNYWQYDQQRQEQSSERQPHYFQFAIDPHTSYFIPSYDTCDAKVVIIDYGTSAARIQNFNDGNKVGPCLSCRYSSRGSVVLNLRYFLFSLISFLPRSFYREWEQYDAESFGMFAEVFKRAGGFDEMNRVRGVLSGFQTIKERFRKLRKYGMKDFWYQFLEEEGKERYWYARSGWKFGVYTAGGLKTKEPEDITYEEIMQMDFFKSKYQLPIDTDDADTQSVELVGRYPNVNYC